MILPPEISSKSFVLNYIIFLQELNPEYILESLEEISYAEFKGEREKFY